MLSLAIQAYYTHDTWQGFLLVGVVCGAMTLWGIYVAYKNFGPPAKRAERPPDS